MESIRLGRSELRSSRLAYGCMRIVGDGSTAARRHGKRAVRAAMDSGYTLFDHADIYADGQCEALFGELLAESPRLRDDMVIASKCGIRLANERASDDPKRYDSSAGHIVASVESSLERLRIEQLDLLLIHRPDFLMNAPEVAAAFERLRSAGKVAHFGVSNFSPSQFALLQSVVDVPLLVNQVEINLHNIDALSDGTLDQCQRLQVTPQAWSPVAAVAYPAWGNRFSDEDTARLRAEIDRQSAEYGVDDWIVALAWLLKHPAGISPVVGSTTPGRVVAAPSAIGVTYSREDWYRLLEARNGRPVP